MKSENGKVSIYDIAKQLNVSASTVSRALKDHSGISEKTRERVKQTAQNLGYRPNQMAVNLKRGRSYTIGVIVPVIHRNFFSSAIDGIEEEANEKGYDVLICQSHEQYLKEKKILASLTLGKVDGLIMSMASQTQDYAHIVEVRDKGMPVVLFDRVEQGIADAAVVIDDYYGAYQLVKHMLAQGNRRIFHYGGLQHVSVWRNRYLGYRAALADAGIVPESHWFTTGEIRQEDGEAYARWIMDLEEKPDGIFCTSDYVALGVLTECRKRGVRVPEEMAVCGFANEAFCEVVQPNLTSVDQSSKQLGKLAARLLIDKLNGLEVNDIVLEPRLVLRESSCKMID